jgi:hypothetical protein
MIDEERGIRHNGVWYPPQSEMFKELSKWEKDSLTCPERMGKKWNVNDPAFQFPKMLYKAERRKDGIPAVADQEDEGFGRRCQLVVKTHEEEDQAIKRGWRNSPKDAISYFLQVTERAISDAAAHREYEDRNMSENAKAEAAAAVEASPLHVAEIPEKPKARRGRKPRQPVAEG